MPFDPLRNRLGVEQTDGRSVADHLASLGMGDADHAILTAIWSVGVSGDPARASKASALRAAALVEGQIGTYLGVVAGYNLADGTGALVERMAADTDADLRLGAPLAAFEERDDGVTVALASGRSVRGRAAIVTTPFTVLRSIRVSPAVAPEQPRAIGRDGALETGIASARRVDESLG